MDHIEEIAAYGYTKLKQVYTADEVAKMLSLVKEWEKKAPKLPDEYVPRLNKNSPNLIHDV